MLDEVASSLTPPLEEQMKNLLERIEKGATGFSHARKAIGWP